MEKLALLAAFGTAVFWAFSAIFFEDASKKVGALAVNFWKVTFAFVFLAISGTVVRGVPFPYDAPLRTWIFLGLSGLVGFVISDYFLFNAYVLIGSRITVIFQSLTPVFTALFAYIFIAERMQAHRFVGMAVTIAGILIVVLTRSRQSRQNNEGTLSAKGLLFAFLSSVFQAGGMVLTKAGLGDYSPISGTQIRAFIAIFGFAINALLIGQGAHVFLKVPKIREAFSSTIKGSVFGPFLGVALSLFSLQNTQAGATSTLMALTPVVIILPSVFILKQKIHALEVVGAAVAVAGAALFFLL
ncbi:MAG TPA: EamA family transporter [Spirochaetaceae bacterium]|jgi:drug/metabolite transporter (DMT)-like permease|nr:EamA family transporter [Spirochaetaceae bacterium]